MSASATQGGHNTYDNNETVGHWKCRT